MYDSGLWWICPIVLIPGSLIWAGLDSLFDYFHIIERISEKYTWRKRTVSKWIHSITGVVSYIIVFLLFFLILAITKYDVLNGIKYD